MALAIAAEGSQVAVVNTEHTLATLATGKTYVLTVDMGNMVNGDEVEFRIKTKVRTGGTSQILDSGYYKNLQTKKNCRSDAVPADVEMVATLKQVAGTARTWPWKILAV